MQNQDSSSVAFQKSRADSTKGTFGRNGIKAESSSAGNRSSADSSGKQKSFYSPQVQNIAGADSISDSLLAQPKVHREFRFSDIDTIRAESIDEPVNAGPKLFSNHQLPLMHNSPQTYNKPNPDWFTIILFVIIFGFVWIRVFYQRILRQIINAFFNSSVSNQIVRDENILIQRASVMLSIMYYLVAALFLYQLSIAFNWQSFWLTDGFSRLIIFAFLIAFTYSAKMILLKIIGYVLDIDKAVASYIFNIFLMNNILGLALLPLVIMIAYVSTPYTYIIFRLALFIIGATYCYRLFRGVTIGTTIPKFSIFYLFLYLCAFEIAPLALIYKIAAG
jgi:hypothetical protein